MFLFLMRHGEAFFEEKQGIRVLSPDGKRDVAKIVSFASQWFSEALDIWHSPLKRAVQTAQIVQETLCVKTILKEKKELVPDFRAHFLVDLIKKESKNLFLVTHMPMIQFLFYALIFSKKTLIHDDFFSFSCASLVALETKRTQWVLRGCVSSAMIQ